MKHITEPLTPPSQHQPARAAAVSDVISKALSKDPGDRYPTTAAFAQALSAVIAAGPFGGTLPLPSAAPTEAVHSLNTNRLKRRVASARLAHAALLVLLAVGIGGVLMIFGKSTAARSACRYDRGGCERDYSNTDRGTTPSARVRSPKPLPSTPIAARRRCLPKHLIIPTAACRTANKMMRAGVMLMARINC